LALISLLVLTANSLPFEGQFGQTDDGKEWVVLVAGSNTWYNYRHQADIYHAYQVVKNHGIPDENIIVFHYDDIANNEQNPKKGIVINKPGGQDVYKGVPKDYIGADVTPANFLAALRGDEVLAKKGKKVLKSGPNDHVFIFFADHGAPDLIAFPSEYLYGEDLNKALQYMNDNKKYGKLVFYLEACESGSMFETLLNTTINIYATTAANSTESSYACYYDDTIQNYLGDVYSVNWIEDSDRKSLDTETLVQQFDKVKQETNTSHVQEYGELSIDNLPLTQFQGNKSSINQIIGDDERPKILNPVDSGDVPLEILRRRIATAKTDAQRQELLDGLNDLVIGRQFLVNHLESYLKLIAHLVGDETETLLYNRHIKYHKELRDCYHSLVNLFNNRCLNLNQHTYTLRKLHVFVNVCQQLGQNSVHLEADIEDAMKHLDSYCRTNLEGGYPINIV
jgi:legumain